ncbi:uncharacterized protein LOC106656430 isoform X2 [Trichogramma pretiosum]|uniref:uncharacterized protein LOC106656430 isoform X2 n=1 Tax=Trichogramma pretiosum TaxID=7493 RepID=UPI000C71B0CA|nr:uncharacterized protein LOC106656430 isoform X2 [Trichogramma pretiosum]
MAPRLMTKEYFREKTAAVHFILLVDYLNKNKITQENLDNKNILKDILRKGMGKKSGLGTKDINAFKETLRFINIDELKKTNLYRINRGILAVACVEHVLYPDKDHKKYKRIYDCDKFLAKKVYKNLREHCGFTTEDELDPIIVTSTRSFFRNTMFRNKKTFLETIRAYLKTVDINVEEKLYIMNASIQFINNKKTIKTFKTVPSIRYNINRKYFQRKGSAEVLINLVNYLEEKEVKEEDLENEKILIDILREGMKKFVTYPPTKLELEEFKKTILNLKIDYLTVANLYRMNRGILTVVCVEYALLPGQDYEEYRKIYFSNCSKTTALYKELSGIPKENKVNEALAKSARSFFRYQNRNLDTIRLYLQNIDIDSEEIEYIKNASIQLIGNEALYADKPGTNTISPIEDDPINMITDDEETLPPMRDIPLEHVDPPSVVPIPVDQGFLSRYSPNEVVLAKRFKSYFWPAQIIEVHSDKIYVTFFPLSEEMEKEEVSSEEDVRAFTDEEIEAACASLCTGLSQVAFKNAVKFASAELN